MPDEKPILSFPLPDGKTIEAYLVELADGRRVVRSREELERLPPLPPPAPKPDAR